ncbi:MAG TPA: hypothetical protein VIM58_03270, partial [Candidatus Methylacidiphilales bacterium]
RDADQEAILKAAIEITVNRRGSESPRILKFDSTHVGTFRLGGYLREHLSNAPTCMRSRHWYG